MDFLLETVPQWLLANFGELPFDKNYPLGAGMAVGLFAIGSIWLLDVLIKGVSKNELN